MKADSLNMEANKMMDPESEDSLPKKKRRRKKRTSSRKRNTLLPIWFLKLLFVSLLIGIIIWTLSGTITGWDASIHDDAQKLNELPHSVKGEDLKPEPVIE